MICSAPWCVPTTRSPSTYSTGSTSTPAGSGAGPPRVTDGVVQVNGEFDDDMERRVVTVLARTVAGVVDVQVPQPA
ncbi:MAG: BON domain-containing protein [Micromonosporaceae bacterium]